MAIDLSSISSATTAAQALSNLVLVSPQATVGYQPQNVPTNDGNTSKQPPALLFHYEGEQTATLQSDITDHYVEDNTAVQDQIALRPEEYTTRGFIGELNDIAPFAPVTLQAITSKLSVISAYTPALSVTALVAYNEAVFAYQTAIAAKNSAVSTWASINGNGGENVINGNGLNGFNPLTGALPNQSTQSKQQIIFQQFYGYWKNRTLFTIQTPWAIFQNMAIKTFRAVQDAETNVISDFEITFKIMRFANTLTESGLFTNLPQGRLYAQSSSLVNNGTSTPPQSATSFSDQFSQNFPTAGSIA